MFDLEKYLQDVNVKLSKAEREIVVMLSDDEAKAFIDAKKKMSVMRDKAIAEKKAEMKFWKMVEERKDEVKARLFPNETDDRIAKIAEMYGVSVDELLDYISSERQVSYFKQTH